MRALLDVNVLIALLDAAHVHHADARAWFERNVGDGWASCPITQNGCIRILSQPGYPGAVPVSSVADRLARATQTPHHEFWPDEISLLDATVIDRSQVLGPRQITDAYLLALAVRRNGRFVTLDRSVPLRSAVGARAENLVIL